MLLWTAVALTVTWHQSGKPIPDTNFYTDLPQALHKNGWHFYSTLPCSHIPGGFQVECFCSIYSTMDSIHSTMDSIHSPMDSIYSIMDSIHSPMDSTSFHMDSTSFHMDYTTFHMDSTLFHYEINN